MIKHTPLPNGNHPILSPICPMGVADMLGRILFSLCSTASLAQHLKKLETYFAMRTLELVQLFFTPFEFWDFFGFSFSRKNQKISIVKRGKMLLLVLGYALIFCPSIFLDFGPLFWRAHMKLSGVLRRPSQLEDTQVVVEELIKTVFYVLHMSCLCHRICSVEALIKSKICKLIQLLL